MEHYKQLSLPLSINPILQLNILFLK